MGLEWVHSGFLPQTGFFSIESEEPCPFEGMMETAYALHVDPDEELAQDSLRNRKKFYWKVAEDCYTSGKPKDLIDLFR